jgi:hypothetical protein
LHRLENAGFIREIKTSSWASNPVIVPKKNTDVQRVCVNYTSLNKHCPKDPFPLPRIDQIIDSTVGCARLSFLDAYSGYNQIKLKKEDKEKMSFITPYRVFCYQVMPFGLKNAGATYQRMMQNCLGSQIGHNIQVTRVNSTNVLDEGLKIREIGRRMNSKVKLVEIGVYRK